MHRMIISCLIQIFFKINLTKKASGRVSTTVRAQSGLLSGRSLPIPDSPFGITDLDTLLDSWYVMDESQRPL